MTDQRNTILNDLIVKLYAQAEVSISANDAVSGTMAAFENGADIFALAKIHPDYSDQHGRIYPLFDEDEGERTEVEDDREIAINEIIENITYQWDVIQNTDRFTPFSHAYAELTNNISSLATWHPNYDYNHGVIKADG